MRFGDVQAFWFLVSVPAARPVFRNCLPEEKAGPRAFRGVPNCMRKLTAATSWKRQWVKAAFDGCGALLSGHCTGAAQVRNAARTPASQGRRRHGRPGHVR